MRSYFAALAVLSAMIAQPVFAETKSSLSMLVAEGEVRAISDFVYTELCRQAISKGWRFTPEQLENGYRRHLEEFKVRLIDQGLEIVPGEVGV